jgi:serine/threonine-protein kinase RsbW
MGDNSWTWKADVSLPSERGAGLPILHQLLDELRNNGWSDRQVFGVHMAVEEGLVNAIVHGNRSCAEKQVQVCIRLSPERLRVEIADEGPGFCPEGVPDCTCDENLHVPSGRGIMLMRNFMTRVDYNERGNAVVMEVDRQDCPTC